MSESIPAVESTLPVPEKRKPHKPKTSVSKESANGSLRKPQLRILAALAKAKGPLSRAKIAEKANVDVAACVEYVGSTDAKRRVANDKSHFPSLVSLGLVKHVAVEHDGGHKETCHELTAKGKKAATKV